ncbi:hypothetical protein Tco_0758643 [Tanacetum coccineum]
MGRQVVRTGSNTLRLNEDCGVKICVKYLEHVEHASFMSLNLTESTWRCELLEIATIAKICLDFNETVCVLPQHLLQLLSCILLILHHMLILDSSSTASSSAPHLLTYQVKEEQRLYFSPYIENLVLFGGYFKPCDSSSPIEMNKMNGGEAFIFNFGSMTETEERSGDHVITNTSKWKWDTAFESSSAVTYSPDDQLCVQNKQHVNQCVTCKDICGLNTRVNNAEFGPIRVVCARQGACQSECHLYGEFRLNVGIISVGPAPIQASKLNGGLGVSSFFALNRALLLKWVWRFISGDGSLWCKVIQEIYGSKFDLHVTDQPSIWCSILREVKSLKDSGFDFSSHCKKRIGDGSCTSFWYDIWLADAPLCVQFPRLFALELDKEIVVANKMGASSVSASFRRDVRDGAQRQQWDDLSSILHSVVLSSSKDRWTCDLSGDGEFKVKVIRNFIDDLFLPSSDVATRWVKFIPSY